MGSVARIAPPHGGMHARPATGPAAWAYVQNGVYVGDGVRSREGSLLYADSAGTTGRERTRLLVPHRDPRGYRSLFVGRDTGTGQLAVRHYSGIHQVASAALDSSRVGFPTWALLNDNVLVARRGDPLRVFGLDDGAEFFFEDVRARDRALSFFEADFDDEGPYLGTVPRGHLVHVWHQRAWLSDGSDIVRSSNSLGDYEGWPAGNWRNVAEGAAEGIRAISSLGDRLCLFRWRSIVVGIGDDPISSTRFSTERVLGSTYGTNSPRAVVEIGGALWFLSQTGEVCRFNGERAESVTGPLREYLRPQTALAFDPIGFRRLEAASFPDATAVYYEPWGAYVVMMEGDTAGVWDAGFAVHAATGRVSVLTAFDAHCLAVKADDEDTLLSADRFGSVYVQDRGPDDRSTVEVVSGSPPSETYSRNPPDAETVPFLLVAHATPPVGGAHIRPHRLVVTCEHRDERAVVVRPIEDSIEIREAARGVLNPPAVTHVNGVAEVAHYLTDEAAERDGDFIIGTHAVAPDGTVPVVVEFGATEGRTVAFVIDNVTTATGETAPDQPQMVGVVAVELEVEQGSR